MVPSCGLWTGAGFNPYKYPNGYFADSQTMHPFDSTRPATKGRFAPRKRALDRVTQAYTHPATAALIIGSPRMGKTSLVLEAARRMRNEAPTLIHVDLTTASTLADVSGRLLREAGRAVPTKRAQAIAAGLASAVGVSAEVQERKGQRPLATIKRGVRAMPMEAQREVLSRVFDALAAAGSDLGPSVALVLEGIERLPAIGGEESLWQLRGTLGRQSRLRTVMTACDADFAARLTDPDGPFSAWAEPIRIEPVPPGRMARWMRDRAAKHKVRFSKGAVEATISAAGPRTGDIVALASAAFDMAEDGRVGAKTVRRAHDRITERMAQWFQSDWRALTPRQQNLVRALAAGENRPFAARVRKHYDLRSSAAVARSLELLMQKGLVIRSESGYAVDNPFFRRWVERIALPDVGTVTVLTR